jgi:hypothetical protein
MKILSKNSTALSRTNPLVDFALTLNVASEYTRTPGGRYRSDGEYSGEDFRETLLRPRYEEARAKKTTLLVILDGGYGYASCFLEEAFGGLARELNVRKLEDLDIVSFDQPSLVDKIQCYVEGW